MAHKVIAVPPEVAARIWPQVEGFIAKAIKRGHIEQAFLPTDILASVLLGKLFLWIATDGERIDAAIVTRRMDYDRLSTTYVCLVGGRNMKAWLDIALHEIEGFARRTGCKAMEGGARHGWTRAAGYRIAGVNLVKEL